MQVNSSKFLKPSGHPMRKSVERLNQLIELKLNDFVLVTWIDGFFDPVIERRHFGVHAWISGFTAFVQTSWNDPGNDPLASNFDHQRATRIALFMINFCDLEPTNFSIKFTLQESFEPSSVPAQSWLSVNWTPRVLEQFSFFQMAKLTSWRISLLGPLLVRPHPVSKMLTRRPY